MKASKTQDLEDAGNLALRIWNRVGTVVDGPVRLARLFPVNEWGLLERELGEQRLSPQPQIASELQRDKHACSQCSTYTKAQALTPIPTHRGLCKLFIL